MPRASLVVIAATLNQFNIPEAGLLLILGIDTFLDMGRSATNAVGNSIATAVVAKWEGELLRRADADANAHSARRGAPAQPAHACRSLRRRSARGCFAFAWRSAGRRRLPGARRPSRTVDAGRAHRHAGQGAFERQPSPSAIASHRFRSRSCRRAASRSATRSSCAGSSSRRWAKRCSRELAIKWLPVTPETRIDAVVSRPGRPRVRFDHQQPRAPEGGRLFADHLRRGTKLMVKKGSPIKSFRDLDGKTVAVTGGTTNEKTMRDLVGRSSSSTCACWPSTITRSRTRRSRPARPMRSRPTTCCSTA